MNNIFAKIPCMTHVYDSAKKEASVTYSNPDLKLAELSNTGAMVELKKLVDNNHLFSYKLLPNGTERELKGKDYTTLKGMIAQDIATAVGKSIPSDVTMSLLKDKTFTAEVVLEKDGYKEKDNYSISFKEQLKEIPAAFDEALKTAIKNIDVNVNAFTVSELTNKAVTVTITDGNTAINAIKNSGAISELEKLVNNNGLVSYEIVDGQVRNLKDTTATDVKGQLLQDLATKLEVTTEAKLSELNGKSASAKVVVMENGCPTYGTYTVKFVVEQKPENQVTATLTEALELSGTMSYTVKLTNATFQDVTGVSIDGKALPTEDIEKSDSDNTLVMFNGVNTDKEAVLTVKGQSLTVDLTKRP